MAEKKQNGKLSFFNRLKHQFVGANRPLFDHDEWDFMDAQKRNELLFDLFKKQFIFNKKYVPFYGSHYASVDEEKFSSILDCVKSTPIIRKLDIRNLPSPYDLLPKITQQAFNTLHFHRGTGGTTGEPTSMFFTRNDWKAVLGAMTRALKELKELEQPIIAFNGYNQGHISGPIFDDTIRLLGGLSITRNFGSSDEQAIKQLKKHQCNLIIAPPISTHKGGSIEHLLDIDAKTGFNYINGDHINTIFCSSTQLTHDLYKELKGLGIRYIYDYYGSTEILPTAISCQESPFDLHILYGHIAMFVVNQDHTVVHNGERGVVLSSKIGSYSDDGTISVNQGTQLLNYEVGDEVTLITDPCPCGRTTPRITGVKRISNVQDKLEGGCEHW